MHIWECSSKLIRFKYTLCLFVKWIETAVCMGRVQCSYSCLICGIIFYNNKTVHEILLEFLLHYMLLVRWVVLIGLFLFFFFFQRILC